MPDRDVVARYKLKLKRLDFISAVDVPAQETARVLAIKRAGSGRELDGFARVAKINEELGLVFCWAFTSKAAGADYFDLHGDNIDDDFVRVCAEFMEGARATDEMHDSQQDGRVIFGMPMTPEVAKIFGVTTDTNGFMVALKPSAEVLEKFKSGEYSGVSIAGLGEREKVAEKSALAKRAALTTATNGHTHLVSCVDEQQSGTTSGEYTPGTDYSYHSHPWVKNEDGSISIGEAAGHAHELATTNRAPMPVDASKSTTANVTPTVKATTQLPAQEPSNMTTEADKIAALEKRNSLIMKMALLCLTLPETHRAHAAALPADEVEPFVSKTFTERDAIVKSAIDADPEVYKTAGGISIRKSQGPLMEQLARQNDANAVELEKARASNAVALYKARARTDIGHLAGTEDDKVSLLKAVDTITDEKAREAATSILKGADAAMKALGKPAGVNPGGDAEPADALDAFNAGVTKYAEKHGIKDEGLALEKFLGTDEGKSLKKAYDASRPFGRPQ